MNATVLIALVTFCAVSSITPGPVNMMLLSSGARFGLRRTMPHLIGTALACVTMALIIGWCLVGLAADHPEVFVALRVVSTLYLLWLAWRIATAPYPSGGDDRRRPFAIGQATAFQWLNPKAWAMVLGAVTSFVRPDHSVADVPVVAIVLVVVNSVCTLLWASSGLLFSRFLGDPRAWRLFNLAMATLLVVSIATSLMHTDFGRSLRPTALPTPPMTLNR